MPTLELVWGVRGYFNNVPFERKNLNRFEAEKIAAENFGSEVFVANVDTYITTKRQALNHVQNLESQGKVLDSCARIRKDIEFCDAKYFFKSATSR